MKFEIEIDNAKFDDLKECWEEGLDCKLSDIQIVRKGFLCEWIERGSFIHKIDVRKELEIEKIY